MTVQKVQNVYDDILGMMASGQLEDDELWSDQMFTELGYYILTHEGFQTFFL